MKYFNSVEGQVHSYDNYCINTPFRWVGQAGTVGQNQIREPRPCLQSDPVWCQVVPHTVLVELNLRHVAVLDDAKGKVVGFSLGDVGAEMVPELRHVEPLPSDTHAKWNNTHCCSL